MSAADPEEVSAAAWLWTVLRHVQWDPERDDPADIDLNDRVMARARERWPWLDEAADKLDAAAGAAPEVTP